MNRNRILMIPAAAALALALGACDNSSREEAGDHAAAAADHAAAASETVKPSGTVMAATASFPEYPPSAR